MFLHLQCLGEETGLLFMAPIPSNTLAPVPKLWYDLPFMKCPLSKLCKSLVKNLKCMTSSSLQLSQFSLFYHLLNYWVRKNNLRMELQEHQADQSPSSLTNPDLGVRTNNPKPLLPAPTQLCSPIPLLRKQ